MYEAAERLDDENGNGNEKHNTYQLYQQYVTKNLHLEHILP